MNITCNNTQPAFQANVIVKNFKLDPQKLEAVQKVVARQTRHYDDDSLIISKVSVRKEDADFDYIDFRDKNTSAALASDLDDFKEWFDNTSIEDIGKLLSRTFKFAKYKAIRETEMTRLGKNHSNTQKAAELNKTKAELTNNPIFKNLSTYNEKRVKNLESIIKKRNTHFDNIKGKITNCETPKTFFWWDEF